MKQKGVFPYDWFDSIDKFDYNKLPSIDDFDNKLCGSYDIYEENKKRIGDCKNVKISDDEYSRANKVWDVFDCTTFENYHDTYLYSDVLLLADIFEKFRDMSIETYGLDPAYYYTTPGLAWDVCLKKS